MFLTFPAALLTDFRTDFDCSMTTLIGLRSDRESLETNSLLRIFFSLRAVLRGLP